MAINFEQIAQAAYADLTPVRGKKGHARFSRQEIKKRYKLRHPDRVNAHQRRRRRAAQRGTPQKQIKTQLRLPLNRTQRPKARGNWLEKRRVALHRAELRKYWRERMQTRVAADPFFALCVRLRRRIGEAFRRGGYTKSCSCRELLGAEFETVRAHIEAQFQPGMTWANRGLWHIDHVIPLASASSEMELLPLFDYRNLRPLWARDNISKGARRG